MAKVEELNKLEQYLKEHNISYTRTDRDCEFDSNGYWLVTERHQIIVYKNGKRSWDAICNYGSYGYEEGLLEIMGDIVPPGCGTVEGWLTAKNVIDRLALAWNFCQPFPEGSE